MFLIKDHVYYIWEGSLGAIQLEGPDFVMVTLPLPKSDLTDRFREVLLYKW